MDAIMQDHLIPRPGELSGNQPIHSTGPNPGPAVLHSTSPRRRAVGRPAIALPC
ncbi:hypothetical protein BO94DRAFT_533996 [Aspergillus sclerotioniger CBS 115572]|uniref:Uncharacterized protein n=1 Tax=Aspergillus sclerotioniger CBS 115572 TaxID=1450535 RepID=A0A317WVX0_9EURO|nr:hypothetical protein BO94DRAFT_533996 [Aspergillus sclerotioniger CBS 115572]PWY90499.1 hypothetical protein BO94DRAFT_533996 [Aspergillus sclerotioniger CBS 115572]